MSMHPGQTVFRERHCNRAALRASLTVSLAMPASMTPALRILRSMASPPQAVCRRTRSDCCSVCSAPCRSVRPAAAHNHAVPPIHPLHPNPSALARDTPRIDHCLTCATDFVLLPSFLLPLSRLDPPSDPECHREASALDPHRRLLLLVRRRKLGLRQEKHRGETQK